MFTHKSHYLSFVAIYVHFPQLLFSFSKYSITYFFRDIGMLFGVISGSDIYFVVSFNAEAIPKGLSIYRYNKVHTVCVCSRNQENSGSQVADMGRGEGASRVATARMAKRERRRRLQKLGWRFIAELVVETGLCRIGSPESEHQQTWLLVSDYWSYDMDYSPQVITMEIVDDKIVGMNNWPEDTDSLTESLWVFEGEQV